MKMYRTILPALAGLLAVTASEAQTIKVKDQIVEKADSTLIVGMTFDLSKIEVPSNRSVVCTPVVTAGDSVRALTPLIVSGRDRHILYERTGRTYGTHNEYELRRENGKEQTFEYTTRTPMAPRPMMPSFLPRISKELAADLIQPPRWQAALSSGWAVHTTDMPPSRAGRAAHQLPRRLL